MASKARNPYPELNEAEQELVSALSLQYQPANAQIPAGEMRAYVIIRQTEPGAGASGEFVLGYVGTSLLDVKGFLNKGDFVFERALEPGKLVMEYRNIRQLEPENDESDIDRSIALPGLLDLLGRCQNTSNYIREHLDLFSEQFGLGLPAASMNETVRGLAYGRIVERMAGFSDSPELEDLLEAVVFQTIHAARKYGESSLLLDEMFKELLTAHYSATLRGEQVGSAAGN